MHAVFKDAAARVLDGLADVSLSEADAWLALSADATLCEVWETDRGARGKLVVTYVRSTESGRWLAK